MSQPPARPEVRSYEQLMALWQRAGQGYGVPWQVLAAINKIESNFGQNMGPSSAGAVGWMQFMPSTWLRWGMDGDGNGVADPWNPEDGVYSAARYLAAAGGQQDLGRAVFAYNHAQWYVDEVLQLAGSFGNGTQLKSLGAPTFFLAADYDSRLASARERVAAARRAVPREEARIDESDWRLAALRRRAGNPKLSAREFLGLDARVQRLEAQSDAQRERVGRARARLAKARSALDEIRAQAAAAASTASTGTRFAADAGTGAEGYVFPVGGGPERVSVGHTHHDYPAADIAAPEGSPLYALADATVTEAYPHGSGACGIGFKLRTGRGEVFVYCHLSYLEPYVEPGASLSAGASVGLVGATGHATGPHLHLAFVPAVSYPQEEPWFRSFAGSAFSWQDAPTPTRSPKSPAGRPPAGPVFRVVRQRVIHFSTG
jgi:murein DD-endopeptidase MepM/ murein hydrolase activator NlpD